MTSRRALNYFNREAERLTSKYDSVDFATVHKGLLPFLPAAGALVADIGAGSGRDALAMSQMGYRVIAIEPSPALRQIAIQKDMAKSVTWIDDRLPDLTRLHEMSPRFAFILCSAVLMFLTPAQLRKAFISLSELLETEGFLWITFRQYRVDGDPEFHRHEYASVIVAAEMAGLTPIADISSDDLLGRRTEWSAVALRKSQP